MTKMKTIFAVIFLALLIPVLLAAPESEAKVYQGKWKNNTKTCRQNVDRLAEVEKLVWIL